MYVLYIELVNTHPIEMELNDTTMVENYELLTLT